MINRHRPSTTPTAQAGAALLQGPLVADCIYMVQEYRPGFNERRRLIRSLQRPAQPRSFLFDVPRVFTTVWFGNCPGCASRKAPCVSCWVAGLIGFTRDASGRVPFTPTFAGDPSNTGTGSRADVVAGCDFGSGGGTPERWFNTACFVAPPGAPVYRRGNAGRNILRGDGYQNVDFPSTKNFLLPKSESSSYGSRDSMFSISIRSRSRLPLSTIRTSDGYLGHPRASDAGGRKVIF